MADNRTEKPTPKRREEARKKFQHVLDTEPDLAAWADHAARMR